LSEILNYDVVVIGAGPAGIEAAKKLREGGKSVLLIDKHIGGNYCTGGSVVSNTLSITSTSKKPASMLKASLERSLRAFWTNLKAAVLNF